MQSDIKLRQSNRWAQAKQSDKSMLTGHERLANNQPDGNKIIDSILVIDTIKSTLDGLDDHISNNLPKLYQTHFLDNHYHCLMS